MKEKREKKDEQHTDREIIMGMRLEHRHLSQRLKNIYIYGLADNTLTRIYIYKDEQDMDGQIYMQTQLQHRY